MPCYRNRDPLERGMRIARFPDEVKPSLVVFAITLLTGTLVAVIDGATGLRINVYESLFV